MYLKRFELFNFRKFRDKDNSVSFADPNYQELAENSTESYEVNNDIASAATLIIGKNNVGKTSIIQALDKLLNEDKFMATDFNVNYLNGLLKEYINGKYEDENKSLMLPEMQFIFTIGLDKSQRDYIAKLVPFMTLKDKDVNEVKIYIYYKIKEAEEFINKAKNIIIKYSAKNKLNSIKRFNEFLNLIEESDFKISYYNGQGIELEEVKPHHIKELISLNYVKANALDSDKCLTYSFNKIIQYRYKDVINPKDKKKIDDQIDNMNDVLTKSLANHHTENINKSLSEIMSNEKIKINISADMTFNKIMQNLIRYSYNEGDKYIPENQFGMGYSHLMIIIAKLIDYMEHYSEEAFNNSINLICIEEPETHMHPQMQELFIRYINDAINTLLKNNNKRINCQIILTTHSSHIVNSKIHMINTFNDINYVTDKKGSAAIVIMNDDIVCPKIRDSGDKLKKFKFLKKHIKYGVSDIFFADAVIFVEGITEYTLLSHYIKEDKEYEKLRHKYITIVQINGTHAWIYENLLIALGLPTCIITDLDINRTEEEKNNSISIDSLEDRETTNTTISRFNADNRSLREIKSPLKKKNIKIYFQDQKIGSYYRSSFEEAFIATNYNNDILNQVLKEISSSRKYNDIVGKNIDYKQNEKRAYEWQVYINKNVKKSQFANELLFKLLSASSNNEIPKLPKYMEKCLHDLAQSLRDR